MSKYTKRIQANFAALNLISFDIESVEANQLDCPTCNMETDEGDTTWIKAWGK